LQVDRQDQAMTNATDTARSEITLSARFESAIPARVNTDAHLVWRGRHLNTRCLIQIGKTTFLLRIVAGRVEERRTPLPLMASWDFAIRGSASAWHALWQAPPPPGWHDLFALSKRGEMRLEGDLHPLLAHLQYFKDVLSLPRTGAES